MSIQADINRDFHELLFGDKPAHPDSQAWRVTLTNPDGTVEIRMYETAWDRQHTVMLDAVKALVGCGAGLCKIHRGHGYRKVWKA